VFSLVGELVLFLHWNSRHRRRRELD